MSHRCARRQLVHVFCPLERVPSGVKIFDWLLALSGLAALFTWGLICLAHIRFRKAWAYRGRSTNEIPFKALFGVWGSYFGLGLIVIVLIAQFYIAISPIGANIGTAEGFFKSYLALPVVLFFWEIGFAWKREGWLKTSQIDVDSGRREIDWEAHNAEAEKRRNAGPFKRILYFMF